MSFLMKRGTEDILKVPFVIHFENFCYSVYFPQHYKSDYTKKKLPVAWIAVSYFGWSTQIAKLAKVRMKFLT
jgi:hypothetical protein